MEVVPDELRFRERLSHQHRGDAVPTPDIRNASTAFKLGYDTIEGRQPFADKMVLVPRTEESRDGTEHAGALVAPRNPATVLKGGLDLFEIGMDRSHPAESPDQIHRAVVNGEDHRPFRRQRELLSGRIIREIVRCRMMRCPFA